MPGQMISGDGTSHHLPSFILLPRLLFPVHPKPHKDFAYCVHNVKSDAHRRGSRQRIQKSRSCKCYLPSKPVRGLMNSNLSCNDLVWTRLTPRNSQAVVARIISWIQTWFMNSATSMLCPGTRTSMYQMSKKASDLPTLSSTTANFGRTNGACK